MADLTFLITGNPQSCELESDDGRISIGGTIGEVVDGAVPLLRRLAEGGGVCHVLSYVSLGNDRSAALKSVGASVKVDLNGALRRRNAEPPSKRWQMPGDVVPAAAAPTFACWKDFLSRTTPSERLRRCYAAAKKANRKRLLSQAPTVKITRYDVWAVIERAKGRCAHCGSLAVESRPSNSIGAPIAWAQVGRRIGSLEHSKARYAGGDNFIENLAWACLWCNTWPSERRWGAEDHGGYYPPASLP